MTPPSTSRPAVAGGVAVDDRGVLVTAQGTGPLVLSVEGRYLWSITPERDGEARDGGWLVAWPHVLDRYLNGTARMSVADVAGETVYFDADVTLGSGEGHIEIVDGDGYPLSVDKVGHLGRSFAATDEGIRNEILEGTQRVLRDLKEKCGVEAYLNYGALLGTIRDGAMIAHDSDTDVCYLSRHESPADLIAESYKIERTMRANGWILLRMSGGDIKVILPLSDGRNCHIDIFVAFYVRGTFYQLGNRNGHLPREVITPLSEVELHGYRFPAPAQSERMLEFLYGPQWRVPDPSFKYNDPAPGVPLDAAGEVWADLVAAMRADAELAGLAEAVDAEITKPEGLADWRVAQALLGVSDADVAGLGITAPDAPQSPVDFVSYTALEGEVDVTRADEVDGPAS